MTLQSDMFAGEALKVEGINRVAEHNEDWSERAVDEIRRLASLQTDVTADDLRPFMAFAGAPKHPNAIGAAFSGAAKLGVIRRGGFRKSTVPSNHSRYVSVWHSNVK